MKNTLIVSSIVILSLIILGNWLGVTNNTEKYKQEVIEAQRHENMRMIEMVRKMHPAQVMRIVQDRISLTSQMIQAESGNPKIEIILLKKLNALKEIKSKDDYIFYLQSEPQVIM